MKAHWQKKPANLTGSSMATLIWVHQNDIMITTELVRSKGRRLPVA